MRKGKRNRCVHDIRFKKMGRTRKKGVLRKRQLRARSEDEDLKALNRKRKPDSRTTDKETLIKPE